MPWKTGAREILGFLSSLLLGMCLAARAIKVIIEKKREEDSLPLVGYCTISNAVA